LGAGSRLRRRLEVLANARHLAAALLRALDGDLLENAEDLLAHRGVIGDLPEVVGELLTVGAQLAERVHQGRTSRRFRIAHGQSNLIATILVARIPNPP